TLGQHGRALGKLLGIAHDLDVAFHVFVRPAARMRDVGKLREDKAQLGEKAKHLAGDRLNVVLTADNDEARYLVADQNLIADGDRVLHAVEPLGHFEIKRRRRAPSYGRRNDNSVGPVHQRLVDLVHLVLFVHLRDRTRPRAGLRGFRVVALAGAEFQIVEPDQPRLGAEVARLLQGVIEQVIGAGKARIGCIHRGGRDAGKPQWSRRALYLARQGVRRVRLPTALGGGDDVDQHAAILDLHGVGGNAVFLETGFAQAGAAVKFPIVPRADDVIAVEAAVAERAADMVAGIRDHAEFAVLVRYRKFAV